MNYGGKVQDPDAKVKEGRRSEFLSSECLEFEVEFRRLESSGYKYESETRSGPLRKS